VAQQNLSGTPLERGFYERDPLEVAPELLGKLLVRRQGRVVRAGRIVEVEAYRGGGDAASHAYRGETRRNATMFGPGGLLYVYFTYGMHYCANVTCWPAGTAGAVLLRALAPEAGEAEMRAARGGTAVRARDLCSGPGRLCAALGIDRRLDGADLVAGDRGVQVVDDGHEVPAAGVAVSERVGLSERVGEAAAWPWRFFVAGDPHVSRGARPRPARLGGRPEPRECCESSTR
jgi:DNA-3-methyladenine glycosylase